MKYAQVLFPRKIGNDKETLTYSLSDTLDARIGQSVITPLRKRQTAGIIWKISEEKPSFNTFPIEKINNSTPLLTENQISLITWMSDYYFCPLHKIIKLFVPKRILENKPFKKKKKEAEQIIRTKAKKLTGEQKACLDQIKNTNSNKFLIRGVTGSGKTEIYSRIAHEDIKNNNQILILVPEISLTPQMISYFEKSIGIKATVINSKLSEGEKYHAWEDIWKNKAKLILGSRSAIFAPFKSLKTIIMDEEHELSYKQESSPRYSTHKIAEKMQETNPDLRLILGSATPSIETACKYKKNTIILKERISGNSLPEIEIVDLRDEFKKGNYSIFSDQLRGEILKALENKRQILLFLNRRGLSSSVVCRDCGYTMNCPDCEMAMTHHLKTLQKPSMICHHCGLIKDPPGICPVCKSVNIKFLGIGTQKIESEVIKEFPRAGVLRADKDTTGGKESFKKIYEAFKNHEADILIGTQMIAKGLHLPKVDLVGVILADIGLNIPNYSTAERNYQLLTQVAGRAGRGENKGKVIIQTYNPENLALIHAQKNNYEEFYDYEITQRKLIKNPPFGYLVKLLYENKSDKMAREYLEKLEILLWKIARETDAAKKLEINLYPSYIIRLRGKYRYILLLKSEKENLIHDILEKLPKEYIMDANLKIDIDPINVS